MAAYYNEIDPECCQWLRNLIAAGHIAPGDVDERSVWDVHPDDVRPYTQAHFFAGIGIWSDALRRAGWPDDRPVWTGSCPCQPFSAAGKGRGLADERHLWPAWAHLIGERRPGVVFGEQVEGKIGRAWLDLVQADMERRGYAFGPVVLPAAGFGAPHRRHRFFFVADANGGNASATRLQRRREHRQLAAHGRARLLGHASGSRLEVGPGTEKRRGAVRNEGASAAAASVDGRMADTDLGRREESDLSVRPARQDEAAAIERGASYWSAADWIPCADGKARPVEPGTFPLVDGAPARLVRLRAYGNAITAPVAEEFIRAYINVSDRPQPDVSMPSDRLQPADADSVTTTNSGEKT